MYSAGVEKLGGKGRGWEGGLNMVEQLYGYVWKRRKMVGGIVGCEGN